MSSISHLTEALNEIDRAIASTLETEGVLQSALDAGVRALEMDAGIILVRDRTEWVVRYQDGYGTETLGRRYADDEAPIATAASRFERPFTVTDLAAHEDMNVGFFSEFPTKSVLVIPLLVRRDVIGTLLFTTTKGTRDFTEVDIEFGSQLASSISLSLENARLYEATAEAHKRAEDELRTTRLLLDAASALSSSVDLKTVLDGLIDVVVRATGRSRVIVSLYDDVREELIVQAGEGGDTFAVGAHIPLSALAPEVTQSIVTKRAVQIDYGADEMPEGPRSIAQSMNAQLLLTVPLLFQDTVIGSVRIDEPGSNRPFTDREVSIVEAIVTQAAAAIENARLYEAEKEHGRLSEALNEIDRDLHSSLDRDVVMRMALEEGARALGADSGAMSLYRGTHFVVQQSYGFDTDLAGLTVPRERERHTVLALESRKTLTIEDITTDPRVDSGHLASFGIGSVIVVPLVMGGRPIGAVFYNFSHPRSFSDAETGFAERLGASLSLAMENARLFAAQERLARINEALAGIDQSIHATLDRDEILQRVAVESSEAIGADSTVLCLIEDDRWVVRYASGMLPNLIGEGFTTQQAPFIDVAVATQRPVAIDDAFNDPRALLETQKSLGVRAVMMSALIVRDKPIGGLFFNYNKVHHFTPEEIGYTAQLASSVALAIENGRLYENERVIANRLQEALMTLPSRLASVEFAHAYHAATQATRVGGDFLDLFEIAPHLIAITIGDVAGKGLDAAVLTSLAKNTIRAHAVEGDKSPAQVLAATNEVAFKATPPESFITGIFGILDCRDGDFVYANAGHPDGAVLRADGSVASLGQTGPLLGAFSGMYFSDARTRLDIGETLFLYTDGLIEARRGRELYGTEMLFERLTQACRLTARVLVDQAVEDVTTFASGALDDDLAILAVRRLEACSSFPVQEKLALEGA